MERQKRCPIILPHTSCCPFPSSESRGPQCSQWQVVSSALSEGHSFLPSCQSSQSPEPGNTPPFFRSTLSSTLPLYPARALDQFSQETPPIILICTSTSVSSQNPENLLCHLQQLRKFPMPISVSICFMSSVVNRDCFSPGDSRTIPSCKVEPAGTQREEKSFSTSTWVRSKLGFRMSLGFTQSAHLLLVTFLFPEAERAQWTFNKNVEHR